MCVIRSPKSELVIDRSLSSKRGVQVVLRLVPAGNSSCKGGKSVLPRAIAYLRRVRRNNTYVEGIDDHGQGISEDEDGGWEVSQRDDA